MYRSWLFRLALILPSVLAGTTSANGTDASAVRLGAPRAMVAGAVSPQVVLTQPSRRGDVSSSPLTQDRSLTTTPSGAAEAANNKPIKTFMGLRPSLPDRASFEELLLYLAQPSEDGFPMLPLSLALRSRAASFVHTDSKKPSAAFEVLGLQAIDLPMSELPGGTQLRGLLVGKDKGDELTMRDLGPLLRGPNGPLQRGMRRLFGESQAARVVTGAAVAALTMGAAAQLGSTQAHQLGLSPSLSATTQDGTWHTTAALFGEKGFKTAHIDLMGRARLPRFLPVSLLRDREDFVEAGGTASKDAEGRAILATRWMKLRTRTAGFEVAGGLRSNEGQSALWAEGEVGLRGQRFGVRTAFQRQFVTGKWSMLSAVMVEAPSSMFGGFVNVLADNTTTAGLLAMAVF